MGGIGTLIAGASAGGGRGGAGGGVATAADDDGCDAAADVAVPVSHCATAAAAVALTTEFAGRDATDLPDDGN